MLTHFCLRNSFSWEGSFLGESNSRKLSGMQTTHQQQTSISLRVPSPVPDECTEHSPHHIIQYHHLCGTLQFMQNFKAPVSFKAPNNSVDGKTPILHMTQTHEWSSMFWIRTCGLVLGSQNFLASFSGNSENHGDSSIQIHWFLLFLGK